MRVRWCPAAVRRAPLLTLVLCAAALGPGAGAALGAVPLVYAPADAANAIHEGAARRRSPSASSSPGSTARLCG